MGLGQCGLGGGPEPFHRHSEWASFRLKPRKEVDGLHLNPRRVLLRKVSMCVPSPPSTYRPIPSIHVPSRPICPRTVPSIHVTHSPPLDKHTFGRCAGEAWKARNLRKGLLKEAWKAQYPWRGWLKRPGMLKTFGGIGYHLEIRSGFT